MSQLQPKLSACALAIDCTSPSTSVRSSGVVVRIDSRSSPAGDSEGKLQHLIAHKMRAAGAEHVFDPDKVCFVAGRHMPFRDPQLAQSVATLGRYKGIADVMGLRLRGFPGWFVTRSYHLLQLPLLSRKLRVVVDWTTSLFFRRDIAELSGLGHPHRLDDPG